MNADSVITFIGGTIGFFTTREIARDLGISEPTGDYLKDFSYSAADIAIATFAGTAAIYIIDELYREIKSKTAITESSKKNQQQERNWVSRIQRPVEQNKKFTSVQ